MPKTLRYFILATLAFLSLWFISLSLPTVSDPKGVVYYFPLATNTQTLITDLHTHGLIRQPLLFSAYVFLRGDYKSLKAGEYFFPPGSTPISIWRQMLTGRGLYFRPFTIVPGWTFKQVRMLLQQQDKLKQTLKNTSDSQLVQHFDPSKTSLEGLFFPETYYYTAGQTDVAVLQQAYALMQTHLYAAWQQRATGLPFRDAYDALIAASLVEKEAYLAAERPVIAGVLINRLQKNMRLQFDPSVIYGLGEHYDGKIYKKDLTQDTPYNTYVHKGLPPTPIAMPSLAAIQAVLHPVQHHYFYFVARGHDGSHEFTETLIQHHTAVKAAKGVGEGH